MRARLTPDGDGYRLNAYKNYVTGGHKARVVPGLVPVPRQRGSQGHRRGRGRPPVGGRDRRRHPREDGPARRRAKPSSPSTTCTSRPRTCSSRATPPNAESFKTLISHINHERCGNAAMCLGAAQGALEYAVAYMNERTIGGEPLADLQGLQWKIADMATQLEGARMLLKRAVHLAGPHGTPPALETAMAKSAANLAAKFVCDEAIQLLGGYGFAASTRSSASTATSAACASAPAPSRSRRTSSVSQACCAVPSPPATPGAAGRLIRCGAPATYRHPRRPRGYLAPRRRLGRASTLDARLRRRADRRPRAGGLPTLGVRRGDVVAWQAPNWSESSPLPRLVAPRRGRGPDPPPGRCRRGRRCSSRLGPRSS